MTDDKIRQDLAFLTENIKSPPDKMKLLRSTLEVALLKLGHAQEDVTAALDEFYRMAVH